MDLFFLSFVSLFITFFSIWLLIPLFKKSFLDYPNQRSSHTIPKPKGLGIVFALISSVLFCFQDFFIPLICLPIAIVGFLDDKYDLPRTFRYIIQVITSLALILNTNLINTFDFNFYYLLFIIILMIFISSAIINFMNFTDGIDGLVVGCNICFLIVFSFHTSDLYLVLLFSLIGFIFWNWHPSKIFMGDAGSTYLGSIFSLIIFSSNSIYQAINLLLIMTPLLGDAVICVIRRNLNGQNIFRPHKLHLYQRLNQAGWSHSSISSLYMSLTIYLSLFYLFNNYFYLYINTSLVFLLGFYLDQKKAIKFKNAIIHSVSNRS